MTATKAIQNPKKRAFLQAFARIGFIVKSAKAAKVNFTSHYEWLHDPIYAAAFNEAREAYIEKLEAEADRRATDKKKPSDVLLIFRLKALRPDVYRELKEVKHTGGIAVEHRAAIAREVRLLQESDPDLDERIRTSLLAAHTGSVGGNGKPALANGKPPGGHRSGRNGHHRGTNGKHPGGGGPASPRKE